jgi:uncharacterized protein with PQ loop repeat
MTKRHKHRSRFQSFFTKKRDPFEYVVYFFSFVTPLFELPQLWEIYAHHSAENVSLTTWSFFCLDNLAWMAYGFRKKEWPVFVSSLCYEILEVSIVVGIVLYN